MSDSAAALLGDNGAAADVASTAQPASGSVWSASFDEDTKAYVSNKGWKEPTDMLNSYRNLERFAGGAKDLVELPSADATPEALESFYNRLGRPEDPEKYGLDLPQGGNPELLNWFKATAHKNGLTAKQAQSLFTEWNGMAGGMQEKIQAQQQQESAQAITALKGEWGQQYDSMIDMGKRAVAALGYDAGRLTAIEDKLGTGEMLKLFATIGSKMGEDKFVEGGRDASGFGVTPESARQQIGDLKTDKEFMGQYLSGNKDAVAKMRRLMEAAHGAG